MSATSLHRQRGPPSTALTVRPKATFCCPTCKRAFSGADDLHVEDCEEDTVPATTIVIRRNHTKISPRLACPICQAGGFDSEAAVSHHVDVVHPVSEIPECAICMESKSELALTACCQKSMCRDCLHRYGSRCPFCRRAPLWFETQALPIPHAVSKTTPIAQLCSLGNGNGRVSSFSDKFLVVMGRLAATVGTVAFKRNTRN